MKKLNFNFNINFKIIIFTFSTLVFFYLLYLSIPSLYNSGRVQKVLSEELLSEFDLNISLSSNISYRILPAPHFVTKDSKLFNIKSKVNNELGEIKDLKIYIKQNNFFKKNNISVSEIVIDKANFYFKKDDLVFIKKYLNNFTSSKNISIKNSKLFLNDKNNNTVFIKSIKNFKLFYLTNDNKNFAKMNGEIFKIPFSLLFEKNFNSKNKNLKIKFKKLPIRYNNESFFKENKYTYKNNLYIMNSKLNSEYTIENNKIFLNSKKSIIRNTPISYEGEINFKPFFVDLNINAKEFDMKYFFKKSFWLNELISSKIFQNENFNAQIFINSDKLIKNKFFKKISLHVNIEEGNLNLNETILSNNKLGLIKIINSEFLEKDGKVFLDSNVRLFVKNFDTFYKNFFIPQKKRKKFNYVDFNFEYDTMSGNFKIYNISFFDFKKKKINSEKIDELVELSIEKKFNFSNSIGFKNYLNKILNIYFLEG